MTFCFDCSETWGDPKLRERVSGGRDEREDEEAGDDEDDDAGEQPAKDIAQHDPTPLIVERA